MSAPMRKIGIILSAPLLALAIAYFSFAYWQQVSKAQALRAELAQAQNRVSAAQQEVEELNRKLRFYQSPRYLDYVEFVAREALGLARPGDTVIVVVPSEKTPR